MLQAWRTLQRLLELLTELIGKQQIVILHIWTCSEPLDRKFMIKIIQVAIETLVGVPQFYLIEKNPMLPR
jgi:hypothetical protein